MVPAQSQLAQRSRASSPASTKVVSDANGSRKPGEKIATASATKPPAVHQRKTGFAKRVWAGNRCSAVCLAVLMLVMLVCAAGAYFDVDVRIPEGYMQFESPTEAAFGNSLAMTIVTELGDKTFFIAALLAMRHGRRQVFLGAYTALVAMTIISAGLGLVSSSLLSPWYTHWAATLLFVYFGGAGLLEAARLFRAGEGGGPSGELEEVEQSLKDNARKGASVVLQSLSLTFLAEWGDKSQVSTIALSSAGDPVGVTFGGIAGHLCCTSLAVLGGHAFAERISERVVVGIAGLLFLIFGILGVTSGGPQ